MPYEALDSQPLGVVDLSIASKVASELDEAISLEETVVTESSKGRENPTNKLEKAVAHREKFRARNEGVFNMQNYII